MDLFSPHPLGNLNELEMLVYRYIMEHPNTVPFMRIRELAAEAHVSTTTVLHFCKKDGLRRLCAVQMEAQGAGWHQSGNDPAGHSERTAELSVEGRHAGV